MCISNNSNESPNPAKSKEYYGGLYISPNGRIDSGSWEDLSSGLRATSRMVRPSGSRPNGDPSRRKTRALKRSSSALSAPGNLSLVVFRASIVCALISACAGWVVTGGVIGKVADMFRSVTGPLHAHRGSWTKRVSSYLLATFVSIDGDVEGRALALQVAKLQRVRSLSFLDALVSTWRMKFFFHLSDILVLSPYCSVSQSTK